MIKFLTSFWFTKRLLYLYKEGDKELEVRLDGFSSSDSACYAYFDDDGFFDQVFEEKINSEYRLMNHKKSYNKDII